MRRDLLGGQLRGRYLVLSVPSVALEMSGFIRTPRSSKDATRTERNDRHQRVHLKGLPRLTQ